MIRYMNNLKSCRFKCKVRSVWNRDNEWTQRCSNAMPFSSCARKGHVHVGLITCLLPRYSHDCKFNFMPCRCSLPQQKEADSVVNVRLWELVLRPGKCTQKYSAYPANKRLCCSIYLANGRLRFGQHEHKICSRNRTGLLHRVLSPRLYCDRSSSE